METPTTRSAETGAGAGRKTSPRSARFKATGHARNYVDVAIKWAEEAAADRKGQRHGKFARLAAKRFLSDLARAAKRNGPFTFDPWHGNDVCDFIEKMPHIEGTWSSKTITLEAPQCFILVNVFGFRRRLDGLRRFSDVYIEMARKGAKSTLTAGVCLYCLTCEEEVGPQIIIGATTGEQAQKVFGPAFEMVQRTKALREAFGVQTWGSRQWPKSISCATSGGFVQPINAKSSTQDGWNPYVGVLDELHAHKDRGLYDVIKSAFGSRRAPLLWRITTAGYNVHGVCFEQRTLLTKILEQIFEADHYFGIIFSLDEGDNEFDEKNWIKANPMLGVTPTIESMRTYALEAKNSHESHNEFVTKRLNRWLRAKGGAVNMEKWRKNKGTVELEDVRLLPCYGGLDLAAVSDITALVLAWRLGDRWKLKGWYWVPEAAIEARKVRASAPYDNWVKSGHLIVTPGDVTDYAYVEQQIRDVLSTFKVQQIGYDKWNAWDLVNRLTADQAPLVEYIQGTKSFNAPWKEMERAYSKALIDHNNDPVLTWAASNLVIRSDINQSQAPDRKKSQDKIDPVVAALMAMGLSLMGAGNDEGDFDDFVREPLKT